MERERFARNMALMAAGPEGGGGAGGGSAERWAAVRGFIGRNMERRPDGERGLGGG